MNKEKLKFNEKSQNKKSTKACSNLISNLQPLNSNFSIPTSNFSHLTSDHKAITLIALVITIIVMLILVGVTVTVAINGGLFNTAKDAARKTQFEADKESLLSAVIGAMNDNAEVDTNILDSHLPEGFTKDGESGDEGYKSKSGNKFYVDKYGNITTEKNESPDDEEGKVTATTDNYGDFVEYGVDLNGDGNKQNDWKVFYVDGQNHTFIIAADYVSDTVKDEKECTEVKTAIEKSNMTQYSGSGNEYRYYWTSADVNEGDGQKVKYHCYDGYNGPFPDGEQQVNNEHTNSKTQCSYPETFMATEYRCSRHVGTDGKGGNTNSRCASTLLCSGNWESFVDTNYGASYAIGGPTLEMWVASWNEKHGKGVHDNGITLTTNGTDSSGYGYYVGEGDSPTTTYKNVSSCTNGYDDKLYFPHQSAYNDLDGDDSGEYCYGYWLASPSASNSNYVMAVYYSGGVNCNNYNYYNYGLRPVVCLNSTVKLASTEGNE